MTFANPAGLALLVLAIPVLLLHMLRPRRRPEAVSSTFLWEQVATPVSSATPWQRLHPSVLLLLQLLMVVLLALGVARPVRLTDVALAPHTVFLIDSSGSMAATDADPDRLGEARRRAAELRRQLPNDAVASIVAVSSQPRVLLTSSADRRAFDAALDRLPEPSGRPDFAGAFTLASSLETPRTPIGFVLVSDGGLDESAQTLIPDGTQFVPIGSGTNNQAVERVVLDNRGTTLHARVSARNAGDEPASRLLTVEVDGKLGASTLADVPAGQSVVFDLDLPAGDRVVARLDGTDLLPADDTTYAVSARSRNVKVVTFGPPSPFLDSLLAALPGVAVEHRDVSGAADGFDLAVYNEVEVPATPGVPFVAIAPKGGLNDLKINGTTTKPAVTLVRTEDPLLEGLDLAEVAIASAQRVEPGAAQILVGAERTPLLVRSVHGGQPYLAFTFRLADSNLVLDVAYPVLMDRIVQELSGTRSTPADVVVGDVLPVAANDGVVILDPGGAATALTIGRPPPAANAPGFYTVRVPNRPERVLAVNPARTESGIRPITALPIVQRPEEVRDAEQVGGQESLLLWVLLPLLMVLAGEAVLARRRTGVGQRQWRVALALRLLVAGAVMASLVDLTVPRPSGDVATVFLIDGSDSVGAARPDAIAWVQAALREQPDEARTAVALFGGDTRLEQALGTGTQLATPTVKIDPSRTDLAAALRLAAAVMPTDSQRRVVLVSDGRATQGDVIAEAVRLRDQGIVVDVHRLELAVRADVAVVGVEAPSHAQPGERFEVRARVFSTGVTTAKVSLMADEQPVEEREVELTAGENVVTMVVNGGAEGVHRYRILVSADANRVPDNDVGFAAVQVTGEQRVLVVEGHDGVAASVGQALQGGGIPYVTVPPSDVPPIEELAGFAAVALVDVPADSLSIQQVTDLGAFARDLGHGLVTVGGTQSYGVGGYRNTALEDVLPVISEVVDPKRRVSVAVVLSVDTSGSMSGGAGGNGSKNQLARTAAARAISALSPADQVGVLGVDDGDTWIIDLQPLPSDDVLDDGLNRLAPSGGTKLDTQISTAANPLRTTTATVKHVIVVTDGETDPAELVRLADDAKVKADEGITTSVIGVGATNAAQLEAVARNGRGRFHLATDVKDVPRIAEDEVVQTSRSFINEGEYLPVITSNADPVRSLQATPPLLGYVAVTAKPAAAVHLRISEEDDPLLASWQFGLGKVSSWMSDGGDRWGKRWAEWDGWVAFWSDVTKDTFPRTASGGMRARVADGKLSVRLESDTVWPDGAQAVARVGAPDGTTQEITLEPLDASTFVGEAPVSAAGAYAVGGAVSVGGTNVGGGTAIATQSYSAEYLPGPVDRDGLDRIVAITGGKSEPTAAQVFSREGLPSAVGRVALAAALLLFGALLWPFAVAVSRLSFAGVASRVRRRGPSGRRPRQSKASREVKDSAADELYEPEEPPTKNPSSSGPRPLGDPGGEDAARAIVEAAVDRAEEQAAPPPPPPSTVDQLLRSKRDRSS